MSNNKGGNWKAESLAGFTTFLTMSYIVVVNPSILSTQGTGLDFDGVLTATVLVCFLSTLLMGLYAQLPLAVAPGMGINAFFAFSLILSKQIPWQAALGLVFWAGILFVLMSATPIREKLMMSIPHSLRVAVAAGIGLFLSFIGLQSAGIVERDPVTLVKFGALDFQSIMAIVGIAVIAFLQRYAKPLAFILGIIFVSLAAIVVGDVDTPEKFVSLPNFQSVFFELDIWGALQLAFLPALFALVFTDIFDSLSTFIGISISHNLTNEKGEPKNLKRGLIVDAIATLSAGLFGSSSGTVFIESAAGIEVGGRTGRTAIVAALCFLPLLFLSPVLSVIPPYATGPVLFMVGAMMFKSVLGLNFSKIEESLPAFVTITLIPLSFSITQGILWGILSHCFLYVVNGRRREISFALWIIAILSVALLYVEYAYS